MLEKNQKNVLVKEKNKPDSLSRVSLNGVPIQSKDDPFTIFFDGKQEITNGRIQKDGSYYDIESLNIEDYNGKIYSDHSYDWRDVLGFAIGLLKDTINNRVTIDGIRFSQKNPLSLLARDMLVEGLLEFSTGTLGYTEDGGRRANHRLFDISLVGLGNNDSTITDNPMTKVNLIELATTNGFDIKKYNLKKEGSIKMKYIVFNNNSFSTKFSYTNEVGEVVNVELKEGEEVEVPNEDIQKEAQKMVDEAVENKKESDKEKSFNNFARKDEIEALTNQINELKKNMNIPVKPSVGDYEDTNNLGKGTINIMKDKIKNMKAGNRLHRLIELERNGHKHNDEYREINDFNKEELIAKNAMTDDESSVGGLIPPYELLQRIEQSQTKYDGFLSKFVFQDSGLSYGWNLGIGNIDFNPIGYCDPSNQSEFETALQNRTQERLSAHTVICDKVSRFSPVNIVNIVASRYQSAYKRALAMFALAEMQVAVDARVVGLNRVAGIDIAPDANGSLVYPITDQKQQASRLLQLFTGLADTVVGGVYVMNAQTAAKLILDLNLNAAGILSSAGTVTVNDYNRLGVALGGEIVIVPNEIMPTLGKNDTRTVVRTAEGGGNVTISQAIFYLEPNNFYGVTNGALKFDIDSFGSYEVTVQKTVTGGGGGTVTVTETRSAKQRGETVLFGEMYRGGGILDFRQVGGIRST